MRISTWNFDSIFFLGVTPFLNLEIWPNERYYSTQFVSATPLKPINRISSDFVVMKDVMCRCTYTQEILIQLFDLFTEQFISLLNFAQNYFVQLRWNWFSVWLPVLNAWNCHSLYTAFSSNVGAWGMWACSLSFMRSASYERTLILYASIRKALFIMNKSGKTIPAKSAGCCGILCIKQDLCQEYEMLPKSSHRLPLWKYNTFKRH